jgi:Flp pilus assembly protein TadD
MTSISIRPWPLRLLLGLALAAGLITLTWQIISAGIGASVMTYVQRAGDLAPEARIEGADIAARWAPDDPLVRYGAGGVYLAAAATEQSPARFAQALAELRAAVKMSPEDYRVWLALGRALDREGSEKEAREALERAAKLAPSHFDPHWTLGNHLLRAGEREAAFAQFRAALASRPSALNLIFDYGWATFGGDGQAIFRVLQPPDSIRAQFASLLIARGKAAEALQIWRAGNYGSTASDPEVRIVTQTLIENGKMADAYSVWFGAQTTEHPAPDAGSLIANGGFESQVSLESAPPFLAWLIKPQRGLTFGLDREVKQEGAYAFRAGFDIRENVDLTIAVQTVPVKKSTPYQLSYTARTRNLENLSNPQIELFDAGNQSRLSVSVPPFRNGDSDWKYYTLDFTTSPETEAVTLRIRRPSCNDPPCPFGGRIWLDDFKLTEKR